MFTNPTAITFITYMVLMVGIGFFAYYYTRNYSDYILGGRSLGGFITALSVGASDMSGWLLMGLPGAVFATGIASSWIAIGLTIGAYINWCIVATRLRLYTEKAHNALTLPDYFSHRFADKQNILRIVAASVILIFFTIYCASGVVAGARLFENTFGFEYSTALYIGAVCTIFYVFVGGFLAVSWTDAIQASLMCIALIVTPFAVINDLGGFTAATERVASIDASMLNIWKDHSFVGIVSLMAWGFGYFGQPHILIRFMAARSIKVIPGARRVGTLWMIFCLAGAIAVGFFGAAYFAQHPNSAGLVTENNERVFIVLSGLLFNPWIAGVLMSAILAAVMSTLSAQLLVCSSTLTEDFYRTFLRPNASQRELVWVGRTMVLAISAVAVWIARNPNSLVLELVSYAWAGFGAAFGPLIIMSLWWRRMTRNGAIAGMIVGAATVLIWHSFAWWGLYEILPGFIFSLIAIIVVSLLDTPPAVVITKTFDEVNTLVKQSR
ncbi:MAG: sodium/proline symporter PutP [Sutterella sp.]|nr:sodium/proline symporter PutP [Sutterella sp.]